MDHEGHKARSFAEAARWDLQQQWAMTPDERLEIARVLRERVYGIDAPDVRESERSQILGLAELRRSKAEAGRPKDLDDLEHLPE